MNDVPALRRLLVVDPCDDCHRLLPGLRLVGWDVDSCTLENAVDRTNRSADYCRVIRALFVNWLIFQLFILI